jgi:hypothetical protein
MQTSSFQSMPCVNEDLARSQVAYMLTQIASEKKNVRLINIDIRESNGMFIAVAIYETIEIEDKVKKEQDEKKRENDNRDPNNPEDEDKYAEDAVLYTGVNGLQIPPNSTEIPKGELLPSQTEPTAFEPKGQSNLVAAPEPEPLPPPPAGQDALKPDEGFLADKMKDDFAVAETPHTYNVDEHALVAERPVSATAGPHSATNGRFEARNRAKTG